MKTLSTKLRNSTAPALFFGGVCAFLICTFVCVSMLANMDLTAGRFVLFMDERLTFDGVRLILHPDGLRSFFDSVVLGDQRYGRSLWVSMAAFSYFPDLIGGHTGQIVAGRMLQVFLIASTALVFAFGLIRNWILRVLLLLAVLTVPFTDYFVSMPKPEPLQMLFLSVFCVFYCRKGLTFGRHWIFAGLAFGTKISTLPALIVFVAFSLALHFRNKSEHRDRMPLKLAALWFFSGLALAVPLLLIPLALGLGGYFLARYLESRLSLGRTSRSLLHLFLLAILGLPSLVPLLIWIGSTFLNTTHGGADQASINAWSWTRYFFESWLAAPVAMGLAFVLGGVACILIYGTHALKARPYSAEIFAPLSVALAGIALNLAIILRTHRLWGHYLYPGMVLCVTGIVFMVDSLLRERRERNGAGKISAVPGVLVSALLLLVAGCYWLPSESRLMRDLSQRTNSVEYQQQYASYQEIVRYLDNREAAPGRPMAVLFNPGLFPPESNGKYEIVEFWGAFTQWEASPDVVILNLGDTPRGPSLPSDAPEYDRFLLERKGYAAHVADKGTDCAARPCFEREAILPNGGEIVAIQKRDRLTGPSPLIGNGPPSFIDHVISAGRAKLARFRK